jgi:hypothetical protein
MIEAVRVYQILLTISGRSGFDVPIAVGVLSAIKMPKSYLKMSGVQRFGKIASMKQVSSRCFSRFLYELQRGKRVIENLKCDIAHTTLGTFIRPFRIKTNCENSA